MVDNSEQFNVYGVENPAMETFLTQEKNKVSVLHMLIIIQMKVLTISVQSFITMMKRLIDMEIDCSGE